MEDRRPGRRSSREARSGSKLGGLGGVVEKLDLDGR